MHFHLPKPLNGWREFVGEVGIIVIGVLIALGAEQLVEEWRWEHAARLTTEAIKDELSDTAVVSYERLVIQPCLRQRIRGLANELNRDEPKWNAAPLVVHSNMYQNVLPVVYRAPTRHLPADAWHGALADGTLGHLPKAQVRQLSGLYALITQFGELQRAEAVAAARLTPLAFDRSLDAQDRTDMLAVLGEIDHINSLMALSAGQMIAAIAEQRLAFAPEDLAAARAASVREQRGVRGECVRDDLPLVLN